MNTKIEEITVTELVNNYQKIRFDINSKTAKDLKTNCDKRYKKYSIESIESGIPLNITYCTEEENNRYNIVNNRQMILGLYEYLAGKFPVNGKYFKNLPEEKKSDILNTRLSFCICNDIKENVLIETVKNVDECLGTNNFKVKKY